MSSPKYLRIGVVCEGDTDFSVIRAIVSATVTANQSYTITLIQPDRSAFAPSVYGGEEGGGWKQVRNWCNESRDSYGGLAKRFAVAPLSDFDLLIVHLDADVADEDEVQCAQPCPPARDTVDRVRAVLLSWAGETTVPNGVVLCVPSKEIEAWVLAGLHPSDRHVDSTLECRSHPSRLLVGRRHRLVRRRSGRKKGYKKIRVQYRAAEADIETGWPNAMKACVEADRFATDLKQSLP